MGQRTVNLRLEISEQIDVEFRDWAEEAGRSKRRHGAVLIRKLVSLRKSHRNELHRLGLLEGAAVQEPMSA